MWSFWVFFFKFSRDTKIIIKNLGLQQDKSWNGESEEYRETERVQGKKEEYRERGKVQGKRKSTKKKEGSRKSERVHRK